MDAVEMMNLIEAEFAVRAGGMPRWSDPHAGGESPAQDEYSRVSDPERFGIIGVRIDAWATVLTEHGFCAVERDIEVRWADPRGKVIARADRLMPFAAGAIPLIVARTEIEQLDVGVLLGAGDPTVYVSQFPQCGCDACDSGFGVESDELDRQVLGVVEGTFRHLTRGDQTITVERGGWSGGGLPPFRRGEIERVIADPVGWTEASGNPW